MTFKIIPLLKKKNAIKTQFVYQVNLKKLNFSKAFRDFFNLINIFGILFNLIMSELNLMFEHNKRTLNILIYGAFVIINPSL